MFFFCPFEEKHRRHYTEVFITLSGTKIKWQAPFHLGLSYSRNLRGKEYLHYYYDCVLCGNHDHSHFKAAWDESMF